MGHYGDPQAKTFADEGRYAVTKQMAELGAFKTPSLRDVTKHAPYMHDGSVATWSGCNSRGGEKNPYLDPKIRPLNITAAEIDALIAFLHALDGEGYADTPPKAFPR